MSINNKLKIIISFVLLSIALSTIIIIQLFRNYQTSLEKSATARAIVLEVFQRRLLADEYIFTKSDRAKSQWFSKHSAIKELLSTHEKNYHTPQEKELFEQMFQGLRSSEQTFNQIVSEYEKQSTPSGTLILQDKERRLASELSVWAQETIAAATNLTEINNKNASDNLQRMIILFIISSCVLVGILTSSFIIIWRSINELNKQKLKDQAIIKSIGDGLIGTDEYGRITLVNTQIEKMFGLNKSEILGKWIFEVFKGYDEKGEEMPKENRPITQALLMGETVSSVMNLYKKDGSKIVVGVTVSPILTGDKPIGAINIYRDVTKEKEIDRMKTEFISLASHQLRTPLSAMKWFLEMLLAGDVGELTPEQRDMLKNVDDSNERIIGLVSSLLNVSRIESGRIMVDPVPTDLKELLESVKQDLKVKLNEKQQTLILNVHPSLPKINIDPKLIRQVYLNLLTNAIKYSPNKEDIVVFVSQKEDSVLSQIQDNGFGIPAKDKNKVFQKFYRGDNIVKLVTDGNGLGLYLVKAIVESSGGKIWFDSTEGKGTTFWFTLPKEGMKPKKGEVSID